MPVTDLDEVAGWVDEAERIVVLTGAGISTDSGIPDFRGPQGVWTRNPGAERLSHIDSYLADPEVRRQAWQARLEHPAWTAQPSVGHHSLVHLERRGKLGALVTQNVDGLHQRAGSDPDRVIEVHGTVWETTCLSCGDSRPMAETLDRVRAGEADPPCQPCGGILKSATVSFGQSLDPTDLERSWSAAAAADLFLAVGTTLSVYPVASLPEVAQRAGARVVTVNGEPTDFDGRADAVLQGSIAEVLPVVVGRPA